MGQLVADEVEVAVVEVALAGTLVDGWILVDGLAAVDVTGAGDIRVVLAKGGPAVETGHDGHTELLDGHTLEV